MKILVSAEEMRALDHYSIETIGIPSLVLMERAALCTVEELKKRRPGRLRVLIFAGTGNNGADGLVMARMLAMQGDEVRVVVTGNRGHATQEWLTQYRILDQLHVPVTPEVPDRFRVRGDRYDVIVDAMLGTGLSREVNGRVSAIMDTINRCPCYTVAVDIPSGISSDTGAVLGNAVRADLTVTFQYGKRGLALFPGAEYAGECVVRDIGIAAQGLDEVAPRAFTLDADALSALPARPQSSNKGTFGRVLIVAGSENMAGAAVLAAEAAYRTGAGLVRVFTPECNRLVLQTRLPEAILTTYDKDFFSPEVLDALIDWASAIVIGPGLGVREQTSRFLQYILQYAKVPVVIDADGLNMLAEKKTLMDQLTPNHILTPHMGEMSRLTGKDIAEIKADPVKAERSLWRPMK